MQIVVRVAWERHACGGKHWNSGTLFLFFDGRINYIQMSIRVDWAMVTGTYSRHLFEAGMLPILHFRLTKTCSLKELLSFFT